jgi:ABC-type glycerol-3-phosphate transport system substrate-binding protein
MKHLFLPMAIAASLLLAGCGGSSNSNHAPTPPPVITPPPPTTVTFTSYVIMLLGQAANGIPDEVNNVMLTFPANNDPNAFDSVVGPQ